jgi:hypothetical protein
VLRFATIGMGEPRTILIEAAGFLLFTGGAFAAAVHALRNQE